MNNKHEHYVYIYLDPTKPGKYKYDNMVFDYQPFYVGKGKGNRCNYGLKDYNNKSKVQSHKINTITKLSKLNLDVIIIKLHENISNDDAILRETEIILLIGRRDLKTGPLTNLTAGGEGNGNKHSKEWKEKLSIPVLQYDLNMNLINEFESIKSAALQMNIAAIQISNVCANKKYYKTACGYIWKYKNKTKQGHTNKNTIMPKHSDATKEKLKKPKIWKTIDGFHPNKGKILNSKYKNIKQYDMLWNLIKIWPTLPTIEKELNYGYANILHVINKGTYYAYGYYWKF